MLSDPRDHFYLEIPGAIKDQFAPKVANQVIGGSVGGNTIGGIVQR